jgi:hypothetical protein
MKKNIRLFSILLVALLGATALLMSQCGKKTLECPTTSTTTSTTTTTVPTPQVAAVTFRPAPGTYEADFLLITAECTTEGASIYFDLDGSSVNAAGLSTNETTIDRSGTVAAVALRPGYQDSDAASAYYELWWWQAATGTGLEKYNEMVGFNDLVFDSAGTLYAAGDFEGMTASGTLLKMEDSTWSAVGNMQQEIAAIVCDSNDNLYVGGTWSGDIEGVEGTQYIAKWDVSSEPWETWKALGFGVNDTVQALAADASGNVYVGGSFGFATTITEDDIDVHRIAKWDPAFNGGAGTWEGLGEGVGGDVYALAYDTVNDILYVGGGFLEVYTADGGVIYAENIAKWDVGAQTWEALGEGFEYSVWGPMVVDGSGNLYVSYEDKVWYWDGSWSSIGPWGFEMADIEGMAYDSANDLLYAVGLLLKNDYSNFQGVLRWNGASWEELDTPVANQVELQAVALDNAGNPYVGGEDTPWLGGVPGRNIWHWGKKE